MIKFKSIFKLSEDRYFGLKFDENNNFKFFVPKQLMPVNDDPLYQIKLLKTYFDLLLKYKRSKENELNIKNNKYINDSLNFFNGMIQIINDYLEFGEFNLYKKKYINNNKKINWSKTIEDKNCFIQDNLVVYNSFISKTNLKEMDDDLYLLYKYALFNSLNIFKNKKEIDFKKIKYSRGKIKLILSNFQDNSYRDRDIFIINALKNIYLNSDFTVLSDDIINISYHEKFEHIWEFMIESIIPKKIKIVMDKNIIKHFNGSYYDINNNLICNGSFFKIDHIIKYENNIAILDSKFYNFYNDRSFNNSPSTESISKQENYKYICEQMFNDFKIYNFFIFPKNNKECKEPEYFAFHKSNKSELFFIKCLALDVETVIKYYLSGISYADFFEEIKRSI